MEITVSTGIVFKVKPAATMVIYEIERQLEKERPKVPRVFIQSKGREEENPNDPEYLAAADRFEALRLTRMYDAAIMASTEIVKMPEGMEGPDGTDWAADLEAINIVVPSGGRGRYIAWVKYYAAPLQSDIEQLSTAIIRTTGVSEEDVAAAAASFQDSKKR